MAYVIKDLNTEEYYRQRSGTHGWYSPDINASRLYIRGKDAQKTIDNNQHHVSFPDNRQLTVVEISLVEVNDWVGGWQE